jgi:hypothetical protein
MESERILKFAARWLSEPGDAGPNFTAWCAKFRLMDWSCG